MPILQDTHGECNYLLSGELPTIRENGIAAVKCPLYTARIAEMVNAIYRSWHSGYLAPRTTIADWYRHVYRELNHEADALANRAMDEMRSSAWCRPHSFLRPVRLRGWFDGGRRSASVASCGWLIKASYESSPDAAWYTIASASVLLPTGTTSVNAELTGAALVTTALCKIARDVCNELALPKQAKFRKLA